MEASVFLGRDCRLVFQNMGSQKLKRIALGTLCVGMGFIVPCEEIRDSIYAGKTLSFHDVPVRPEWDLKLLATRHYHPLQDDAGNVFGFLSLGFTRPLGVERDTKKLAAIVAALESPEPPIGLLDESLRPRSCPDGVSPSQLLAARLRRFLLPPRV